MALAFYLGLGKDSDHQPHVYLRMYIVRLLLKLETVFPNYKKTREGSKNVSKRMGSQFVSPYPRFTGS
jgi:hypothetical protein